MVIARLLVMYTTKLIIRVFFIATNVTFVHWRTLRLTFVELKFLKIA